eukprot:scaffold240797_cov35-Tisochrysis_lutea.AAC.6
MRAVLLVALCASTHALLLARPVRARQPLMVAERIAIAGETRDREASLLVEPKAEAIAGVGRPYQVAIAGGGIGGLCTALVLLNMGFEVSIAIRQTENEEGGGIGHRRRGRAKSARAPMC